MELVTSVCNWYFSTSQDIQLSVDVMLVTIEVMDFGARFFSVEASAACALKLRKLRSS